MNSLKYLWINNCGFYDITPIYILYKKQLELYERNKSDNIDKGFVLFDGLKNLHLVECNISDIAPLSECSYLYDVNLSYNNITDLKPLSSILTL